MAKREGTNVANLLSKRNRKDDQIIFTLFSTLVLHLIRKAENLR